jgi:hypothetical protein
MTKAKEALLYIPGTKLRNRVTVTKHTRLVHSCLCYLRLRCVLQLQYTDIVDVQLIDLSYN